MPLDALCLSILGEELRSALVGGRIDKIHQPARDEVVLAVRAGGTAHKLLLSASTTRGRAQLTASPRENPAEPPMFCMLLRKYLTGGRILSITQPDYERLLVFKIESSDELGDLSTKTLVLEAMGRHSNLILLDPEGRIVDCLRRVDQDMSSMRQILPGMFYRLPKNQEKLSPIGLDIERKKALGESLSLGDKKLEKWLVSSFSGLSPLVAREIAFRVSGETDCAALPYWEEAISLMEEMVLAAQEGRATAQILLRDGRAVDFSYVEILQYGPESCMRPMENFSTLFDSFYAQKEGEERMRQKGQDLHKSVSTARDRIARKLVNQREELLRTESRETLRQLGDLVTAYLYQIEKGMTEVTVSNFYDENAGDISIKLDRRKSAQENAAQYYKDYNRAKTAEKILTEQIAKGEMELVYLDSVLETLARATGQSDLDEIRRELEETSYVRRRNKGKGKMKLPKMKPLEFRTTAGFRISVGRNNSQNDELTHKLAGRHDMWFHVKDIHGAHVILWLEGEKPDLKSIEEAATIAAYYSQAKGSGKIPVDYCLARFVKKPAGGRPGMVIFTNQETAMVAPDESLVERLRV